MALDSLAPMIQSIADRCHRWPEELRFTLPEPLMRPMPDPVRVEELSAALAAEPHLRIWNGHVQSLPQGSRETTFRGLADWLVWRATQSSAEQALRDLDRYHAAEKLD